MSKIKLKVSLLTKIIFIYSTFVFVNLFTPNIARAQNVSLSITPPIFEIIIQPGKEVKQIYTIGNNGSDTHLSPRIVYFVPDDIGGNVEITENPAPEWIHFNKDQFEIKSGKQTNFEVNFSPPADIEETDHFLSLIFESQEASKIIDQNTIFYNSSIGSNILITISKDGNLNKSSEILEFNSQKFIDPIISSLNYKIILRNNGNSFWKPNGKIMIDDNTSIKLAPMNVLSGSNREIKCNENESLIDCKIKIEKITIGKIVSRIEYTLDEDPKIYSASTITYVFPISLIACLLIILTIFRLRGILKSIRHIWLKRRSLH